MSEVIVDTNVAVVANGQNLDVIESCTDACILFIARARDVHIVLIDCGDEIRAEYAKALRDSRPQGLGAQFLMHIYQQQYNPKQVRRVQLIKGDDGEFVDFPNFPELASFDRDDRKFAALARKTQISVTTAIDSDWADYRTALNANDIQIVFLCGPGKAKWFKK